MTDEKIIRNSLVIRDDLLVATTEDNIVMLLKKVNKDKWIGEG